MPHRGAQAALSDGMDAGEFVDYFVVDATPAIFAADRFAYHAWRRTLGVKLDVDPAALHVVGSSCTGFSLDPSNDLRPIRPDSDVDVAVISAHHFDVAWRFLRQGVASSFRWPSRVAYSIKTFAPRDVFAGCIATDQILPVLPFGLQWMEARNSASLDPSVAGRAVNFRLYRDLDGLRAYQVRGLRRLQEVLAGGTS